MQIDYRTLEDVEDQILFEAFQRGFEDYQVPMNFTLEKFLKNNVRRGLAKDISMGAFHGDQLIGFVLNGKRLWTDEMTAYDMGTAVIKKYRGQGITSEMLRRLNEILVFRGIHKYLLEVLQNNQGALNLYLKQGFRITREFDCLTGNRSDLMLEGTYPVETVDEFNWAEVFETWDQSPSWQCSMDSVKAIWQELNIVVAKDGPKLIGYGITEPETQEIIQIGVNPRYRRKGIGSSLLYEMMRSPELKPIKVLNIESDNTTLIGFLKQAGFKDYLSQYEMMKDLRG